MLSNSVKTKQPAVDEWLDFSAYVSKYRYCSYWHQLDEVFKSSPNRVLEIGIGAGVMASYLDFKGIDVTTLDIETALDPSVVGTVTQLPFHNKSFDTVVCCQVLEHLPFVKFDICLRELARICKKKLILSLPDKSLGLKLLIRVPNFIFWDFSLFIPWALREPIKKVREHYWEIGRRGYPVKKIKRHIEVAGFDIERQYRVPEFPYHNFFIATPAKN